MSFNVRRPTRGTFIDPHSLPVAAANFLGRRSVGYHRGTFTDRHTVCRTSLSPGRWRFLLLLPRVCRPR